MWETPIEKANKRTQDDPEFNVLVNTLESLLYEGRYTPTELRQAVILAATRNEYRTMRPLIYGPDSFHYESVLGKNESGRCIK